MAIFDKFINIISGCRQEAVSCAKMHDLGTRFYYVSTPSQVRYLTDDNEVWVCGEYYELKQWPEIEKQLKSKGIKPLHKVC